MLSTIIIPSTPTPSSPFLSSTPPLLVFSPTESEVLEQISSREIQSFPKTGLRKTPDICSATCKLIFVPQNWSLQ